MTSELGNKLFEESRNCPKEYEAILLEACVAVDKLNYLHLEIATEVAWQTGDILSQRPRAESRWLVCNIVKRIIEAGIIDEKSEDIDEIVSTWLEKEEAYKNGGFA
jgi:hypothetical protein